MGVSEAFYIPAALALIALRARSPNAERTFRIRGGPVIAVCAATTSLTLLYIAQPNRETWMFSGEVMGLGILFWLGTAVAKRLTNPRGNDQSAANVREPG